jgi:signal transduction histidine kinase
MKFKLGLQKSVFSELKNFISTPRRISAILIALVVFEAWNSGTFWSGVLKVDTIIPSSNRPTLMFICTVLSFVFVYYWSKLTLKRKKLFFWPIEYVVTIIIALIPTFTCWVYFIDSPTITYSKLSTGLIFKAALVESIVGFLIFRIERRTKELEEHQVSLVDYEEKFLSTIYDHLHDNIQTRLFGIGIQLNQIRQNMDEKDSDKIASIISEVETIRTSDVRNFGIEFTPPIAIFGLIPSLVKLLESHNKMLTTNLHDLLQYPLTKQEEEIYGLGIYRITEQAIINSLVHGHATELDMYISREKDNLNIKIINNGQPLKSSELVQGHGFAVIDGWVSKLKGKWTISDKDTKVCLEAIFEH